MINMICIWFKHFWLFYLQLFLTAKISQKYMFTICGDVLKWNYHIQFDWQSVKSEPFELLRWFIHQKKALEKPTTKLLPVFKKNCTLSRYRFGNIKLTLFWAACSCAHLKNRGDNLLSKLGVELSLKETLFLYHNWTKNTMVFWQLSWSSFEYKKLVRELSKKSS